MELHPLTQRFRRLRTLPSVSSANRFGLSGAMLAGAFSWYLVSLRRGDAYGCP
jgi:hypothetical protein